MTYYGMCEKEEDMLESHYRAYAGAMSTVQRHPELVNALRHL